ncbi:dTDP-4-dehydrorhamnose reductase, partial [uncultured Coleofasciculus sp.]
THEYPTPAQRPAYSVLENNKIKRIFGLKLLDWHAQLEKCTSE